MLDAAKIVFSVSAFPGAMSRFPLTPALESLISWGPGGNEQYEQFMSIIYILWGIYSILKETHNEKQGSIEHFLDLTIVADVAHNSITTVMASFHWEGQDLSCC